jgi:hypothetical protein
VGLCERAFYPARARLGPTYGGCGGLIASGMAKRSKPDKSPVAIPQSVTVKIVLDAPENVPSYYVNYAEVNFSINEFALSAVRVPIRFDSATLKNIQATGEMPLQADVQLLIPPTVIVALIRALSTSKEGYEKQYGIELKDWGAGAKNE